ncbi:putative Integral membrane sensor signal transduction histidine kinase [uncultured Desulfobacterium sp.]|uniref:histidine kinase n=1 Tax=uncultured Desulfobacterium sp. TaxID=201089 RepID=A0A445N0W2_9BACT|nr:putative Integral membrane sensor signal transduction histidine kinase [uncultured Desulfobacterium sp.]
MFIFRSKRILFRIIFPFTLLFGLTTILSWLCSAYFITRYIDQNLETQMKQVASILTKSGYVLNPVVLGKLKEAINIEIVLFDLKGKIFLSTFNLQLSTIEKHIKDFRSIEPSASSVEKDTELTGIRYKTLISPISLPGHGPSFLSLWTPIHEADHLKGRIIIGIGIITFLGIIAMTVAGFIIARTITAPVEELVKFTTTVSEGDFSQKANIDSRDEIGSLARSFNLMVDRLKAFEKKLVESEKMATAGQMIAGLTHEIRNPLTSIRMLGQVLQNRLKDQPETHGMLGSMVTEIDRLDRIIQQMVARINPGELQRKLSDLNRQIDDVIKVAGEGLTAQKIAIEQNLFKGLPEVFIDEEKIKQVVWNLILNAKEAMPKGGIIMVSTAIINNGSIEILVDDSGPSITSEDTEQLFQPFFTTKPEGMGLGLSMSRKIIEQHGGTLTLKARAEGGMRARIILHMQGQSPVIARA